MSKKQLYIKRAKELLLAVGIVVCVIGVGKCAAHLDNETAPSQLQKYQDCIDEESCVLTKQQYESYLRLKAKVAGEAYMRLKNNGAIQ